MEPCNQIRRGGVSDSFRFCQVMSFVFVVLVIIVTNLISLELKLALDMFCFPKKLFVNVARKHYLGVAQVREKSIGPSLGPFYSFRVSA